MRLEGAMKKTFGTATTILFSLTLPLAFAAAANAQQLQPSVAVVLDATGKLVGPVVGTDGTLNVVVAFTVNRKVFTVFVTADRFYGVKEGVVFASNDCSGTPYISVDPGEPIPGNLFLMTSTAEPGSTVYRALPGAGEEVIVAGSALDSPGTGGCRSFEPGLIPVVASEALIDLAPLFTPPFRLR